MLGGEARRALDQQAPGALPAQPTLPVPSHGHWMPMTSLLAAAGYNFSLLLKWLKEFLRLMIAALICPPRPGAA